MNKKVLINWRNANDKKIKNCLLEVSNICYLLPDIDVYNGFDYEIIKTKTFNFKYDNIFVVNSDIRKSTNEVFPTISSNQAYSVNSDGIVVSSRNHYYNIDVSTKYFPSTIIKEALLQNKKVFYVVEESNVNYLTNRSSMSIFSKMNRDLLGLSPSLLKNLTIIYEPTFINDKISISNQHIDDMIKVIRSFMNSSFRYQCPILLSVGANSQNVLSFCVSNNFDGFMVNCDINNTIEALEIIRKVHGWQRIVKNQLMKKRKSC